METISNTKYKIINGINKIGFNKVTAMLKEAFWNIGHSHIYDHFENQGRC
jgi:hypothetical protein